MRLPRSQGGRLSAPPAGREPPRPGAQPGRGTSAQTPRSRPRHPRPLAKAAQGLLPPGPKPGAAEGAPPAPSQLLPPRLPASPPRSVPPPGSRLRAAHRAGPAPRLPAATSPPPPARRAPEGSLSPPPPALRRAAPPLTLQLPLLLPLTLHQPLQRPVGPRLLVPGALHGRPEARARGTPSPRGGGGTHDPRPRREAGARQASGRAAPPTARRPSAAASAVRGARAARASPPTGLLRVPPACRPAVSCGRPMRPAGGTGGLRPPAPQPARYGPRARAAVGKGQRFFGSRVVRAPERRGRAGPFLRAKRHPLFSPPPFRSSGVTAEVLALTSCPVRDFCGRDFSEKKNVVRLAQVEANPIKEEGWRREGNWLGVLRD